MLVETKRNWLFFTVIAVTVGLGACSKDDTPPINNAEQIANDTAPKIEMAQKMENYDIHKGTIVYKTFEGGFFAFEGFDGTKLILNGLDKQHRKNGLIVEVTGYLQPDLMTTQQYGSVFKLVDLKVIDDSKVTTPPAANNPAL